MNLQDLLAQIEVISAKDVEVGRILKGIVLYLAKLEKAQQTLKGDSKNGN